MKHTSTVAWRATTLLIVAWAARGQALTAQRAALDVVRDGDSTRFGPGITAASHRMMKYELIRPAHVIVLRVTTAGQIEPVFPERSGDRTERKAGKHGISVGDVAVALREYRVEGAPAESKIGRFDPTTGRIAPASQTEGEPATFWLLIASDVPTTALQLQDLLRALQPLPDLDALIKALPRAILSDRTTSWASYVTQAVER